MGLGFRISLPDCVLVHPPLLAQSSWQDLSVGRMLVRPTTFIEGSTISETVIEAAALSKRPAVGEMVLCDISCTCMWYLRHSTIMEGSGTWSNLPTSITSTCD